MIKNLKPLGMVVTRIVQRRGWNVTDIELCTNMSRSGTAVTLFVPREQKSMFKKGQAVTAFFKKEGRHAQPLLAVKNDRGEVYIPHKGLAPEVE